METDLVAPATPIDVPATPTDVTPTPESVADQSIAEHEAQFGKTKSDGDEPPAERPRHRAKSQQATPADVPRIAELTKKLREAERERDEWKAKHATPPAPAPAAQSPKDTAADSKKPTWAKFEDQIGATYDTWAAAQDAFQDARDEWKTQQALDATRERESQQSHQAVQESYVTKARELAKTTPDLWEKLNAAEPSFAAAPQLLQAAVITADNGPEIAYYLATHPDILDDLSLLTDGKAVTQASVALVQRRFTQFRTAAVVTGSAPVVPRPIAPRPPNPVRTGPQTPKDDPPGDDASIAEHERYYGKRKR